MKKILSILLVTMMVLSCFSVVSFAEESYDATFKMVTNDVSYNAGDYLRLDFIVEIDNEDEMIYNEGYVVHVAYDSGLLSYATNKNEVKNAFGLSTRPATLPAVAWLATSSSGIDTNRTDGEFIDNLGYTEGEFWDGDNAYTVFFKVNEDVKGTHELNFKWVLGSKNIPSAIKYSDGGLELKDYNVKFVDTAVTIVGEDIPEEEAAEFLPYEDTNVFAAKNEFENNTVEINGVKKNIGSRYAVACSKVPARNAAKVEAGFIISNENAKLTLETAREKNIYKAANFAFDNIFTGLFYGPGLEAGKTYFVIPYVTYSDGVTIYASEAKSFTMPE